MSQTALIVSLKLKSGETLRAGSDQVRTARLTVREMFKTYQTIVKKSNSCRSDTAVGNS